MPTPTPRKREIVNDWKAGASRTLPIDRESTTWDAAAAENAIFALCGFDSAKPDLSLARKAFLIYDSANPTVRSSYKYPIAQVVDGRLMAMAVAIRSSIFGQLPDGVSDDVKAAVRETVEAYSAKFDRKPGGNAAGVKRSLYHVGWLAYLLEELGYLQDSAEFEAALEEDGSAVPAQLLEALKQLGSVLVAMTQEEVAELLAGDDEDDVGDAIMQMSDKGIRRALVLAVMRLDAGAAAALTNAARSHLRGQIVTFTTAEGTPTPLIRAGRVLSADNERCLRDAHDHMSQAVEMVRSVVDQCDDEDPDDEEDDDDDQHRAARKRRAQAIALRHSLSTAATAV